MRGSAWSFVGGNRSFSHSLTSVILVCLNPLLINQRHKETPCCALTKMRLSSHWLVKGPLLWEVGWRLICSLYDELVRFLRKCVLNVVFWVFEQWFGPPLRRGQTVYTNVIKLFPVYSWQFVLSRSESRWWSSSSNRGAKQIDMRRSLTFWHSCLCLHKSTLYTWNEEALLKLCLFINR